MNSPQSLIEQKIADIIVETFGIQSEIILSRPDPQFGDFATNVALQISNQLGKNSREIANELQSKIQHDLQDLLAEVTIAGPGFINLKLADSIIVEQLKTAPSTLKNLEGKVIVTEYSDPNPFKILHAGHLYTSVVGDAISNLLEAAGANVHRVNFGGDVGLHVGKTIWAILRELDGENPEKLQEIKIEMRSSWLADCYIKGTNAYEEDEIAKQEITTLNKRVYQLHSDDDKTSPLARIYWTTRKWSYDYFDEFYKRIGTKFEKYYPESSVADLGLTTVKAHMSVGKFEESDGAVVFKGEPYGLHTRVFINQQGIPTYEAKDVGLIFTKKQDYNFDASVIITGNEQEQYMAVVLKAIEQFEPKLVAATTHITHGLVKLRGGVKMSSRKGNILRATDVLDAAATASERSDSDTILGAVKYSFLKVRTGGDIIYDPEESVAIEGNSGPYLQYAHARACSILVKSSIEHQAPESLEADERILVAKLTEYTEVVAKATNELAPHLVCTYLYELAQTFNRFYENNRVIDDPREAQRLFLVSQYAAVLKSGLNLLGIHAPEKM